MSGSGDRTSIAVVGGGIAGVSAALALAESGAFRVTLFEKGAELGGLCRPCRDGAAAVCDRYYHVILPSDEATLAFIERMGLGGRLHWTASRSGFFRGGRTAPFSSSLDFARFPFLSPWGKFRLGWGIFRASRMKSPADGDELTAAAWLERVFGAGVAGAFWDPLLRSKLGEARRDAPASFIWATIRRLGEARRGVNKKERLGYVEGGYAAVFEAARAALAGAGVEVHLSAPVLGMALRGGRIALRTPAGDADFDRALFAVPDPAIPDPDGGPGFPRAAASDHLGVVCALLRLKRGLTPYYVLNLLDTDLPFTGVIESTNVVPPDAFGGARLVYLPKYVTADDRLRNSSDADVLAAFLKGLRRIAPDLGDDEILDARVFRDDAVFPRPKRAADRAAAEIRLPWPGAYKANATLLTDDTLNNDAMLKIAAEAVREIVADYRRKR